MAHRGGGATKPSPSTVRRATGSAYGKGLDPRQAPGSLNPAKQAANAWFAATCSAIVRHPAPWTLLLETRKLLTLKSLAAAAVAIRPSATVVANPDLEECESMRTAEPEIRAYAATSHSLLGQLDDKASMQRRATLRSAAVPHHATQRHAMPSPTAQHHATRNHATRNHTTPRHATPRHAAQRSAAQRNTTRFRMHRRMLCIAS